MKNTLYTLACFNHIEKISKITSGLSQACYKVSADKKVYFAKTITDNIEAPVAIYASKSGLSPSVIYHDQHWLISNFIDANNLASSTINTDDKIEHAIKLMVRCHQLTAKPIDLAPADIINKLINKRHYCAIQKAELRQLTEVILTPINDVRAGVCCHGDLNFSNVLINQAQHTWLIDYECACIAPIEYDLAMFIAVNNLASDKVTVIIAQYQDQFSVSIDPQQLKHYLRFCYFINALWYFNTYQEKMQIENKQSLLNHSKQQRYALQSSFKAYDSTLLSRLGIKLTNILATLDLSNQA
ncbi:MAG: phosphotransferase [Colwellia sp.]|nr:phosphotransferase [Colwellia sp.]